MNENINIAEILKDAPEGTKLWSIIHGPVELVKAPMQSLKGDIICKTDISHNNIYVQFDKEGHWLYEVDGRKCYLSKSIALFPSYECFDWKNFKAPQIYKHFNPFEKVLVASGISNTWEPDIYRQYNTKRNVHECMYYCNIRKDSDIIPYKGNEDKVGKLVEIK